MYALNLQTTTSNWKILQYSLLFRQRRKYSIIHGYINDL